MNKGSNPLSRPPPAGSPIANERWRSVCARQNSASRPSIRSKFSRGSGCQTPQASTSRSSVVFFSHCRSSSSEPEESESMDGRLTRFSPLPSFAVAAAFAAAWGMLLILVNIGSGGHSPSSAAKISSCCWQRSMSMSRLDSAGGQLEEHESSWAELGMTRVIVVCNGGCAPVAVGIAVRAETARSLPSWQRPNLENGGRTPRRCLSM